jgi:hypothetical protein
MKQAKKSVHVNTAQFSRAAEWAILDQFSNWLSDVTSSSPTGEQLCDIAFYVGD